MAEKHLVVADLLQAQNIALILIIQDILGRQAAEAAEGFNEFLGRVHAGVLDDLRRFQLVSVDPQKAETILLYAESAIDQVFGPIQKGPAPSQ